MTQKDLNEEHKSSRTVKGRVTVKIPKGTPNENILKLRGLGISVYKKKKESGNLLVKIDIVVPDLCDEEMDLFGTLAAQ